MSTPLSEHLNDTDFFAVTFHFQTKFHGQHFITHTKHTHTFFRTVSAEGLGECGGVWDVVGWILFRHQSNHWAICHLEQDFNSYRRTKRAAATIYRNDSSVATATPNAVLHWIRKAMVIRKANQRVAHLIMSQCVESLPVVVYLGGDIFVL